MAEEKTPENMTMFQAFEWNVPPDQKQWQRLSNAVEGLKKTGVDAIWIPPACKATDSKGNGYDIYDIYDLGEFDQKGSVATKWGPKDDLVAFANKAKEHGVGIYFDAVLNHKAGGDEKEKFQATEVSEENRTQDIAEMEEIEAWTKFTFPGRGDTHSKQKYDHTHFSGVDYNAAKDKTAIYKIQGDNKSWSQSVDHGKGNYDFLMFNDLDHAHPEVRKDLIDWGNWLIDTMPVNGFRFDAARHFSRSFLKDFVSSLRKAHGELFCVGEFWKPSLDDLVNYLDGIDNEISLFDVPLFYNFATIAGGGEGADLSKVFEGSLLQKKPQNTVTLVGNHDTQPGQTMATPIDPYFKPLAYSLILLRTDGYPCVWWGDLYGAKGDEPLDPIVDGKLADLILARKLYAYGQQNDYFDAKECVGWTREGTKDHPFGLACVMSIGDINEKKMQVGTYHKGETWTDVMGWEKNEIKIDDEGFGMFTTAGKSMALYVNKDAEGRDRFGHFDSDIYKS